MLTRSRIGSLKPKVLITTLGTSEPTSIQEALALPNWKLAMEEEYAAPIEN